MLTIDSIEVSISDHTINVPALLRLRLGFGDPNLGADFSYILEGGIQKEVLFSSNAKVSNKRLGIKDKYDGIPGPTVLKMDLNFPLFGF